MNELISVIIPTFNVKKDIKNCIDSILNQSYENTEIIIVDDKSTDGTYEYLIENYSDNNQIKIYQNQENLKAAYTRNKAIKYASGSFIAIQDADDYSDLNRLEIQYEFLIKNENYDFVGSNSYSYDDEGIWKKTNLKEVPVLDDFYQGSFPFVHGSIMFRRNIIEKVNGYKVSKETERGQDGDMLIRMYQNQGQGYNLREVLYFYQENLETVKRRNLGKRILTVKNKLKSTPWKGLTLREKLIILKVIFVGFVPSKLWYRIMKARAKKTLK